MAKNIQISIQEALLTAVDRAMSQVKMTRSALIAEALKAYLKALETRLLEQKHEAGYWKKPARPGELGDWEKEQVWPEM